MPRERFEFNQSRQRIGRRVASYAQGFNLTLPGEFQLSDLQWKRYIFEVRDALKKHLNLTNESFYCNLHEEPTKNSHLNLLVSRCNANAEVNQKLDQRNTVKLVKESFTAAVLKHCSISVENYQKKSKEVKKKKAFRSKLSSKAKGLKNNKRSLLFLQQPQKPLPRL